MSTHTLSTDRVPFGSRELADAGRLLTAWAAASGRGRVTVTLNLLSGLVFLTNAEIGMTYALNGAGTLEEWVACATCHTDGFSSEVGLNDFGDCALCQTLTP